VVAKDRQITYESFSLFMYYFDCVAYVKEPISLLLIVHETIL
jgi:hypothetical protein